jgi:hypothetical protein
LEYLDVDGRIILEWILHKQVVRVWARLMWLRVEISGGHSEHGTETSGSIKRPEIF